MGEKLVPSLDPRIWNLVGAPVASPAEVTVKWVINSPLGNSTVTSMGFAAVASSQHQIFPAPTALSKTLNAPSVPNSGLLLAEIEAQFQEACVLPEALLPSFWGSVTSPFNSAVGAVPTASSVSAPP